MNQYREVADRLVQADAILIGASNGFSISEGLHIFADNQDFENLFGDLKRRYGLRNILDGYFAQWPTEEEKWGFLSRLINHYSIGYTGSANTEALKHMIGDKPYHFITSNGENHFELAGYAPEHIYEIEGSWKSMQCAHNCHDALYPVFPLIPQMATAETDGKIPTELVPHCPVCGGPMKIFGGLDSGMTQHREARQRYEAFIQANHGKKLVVLELGIGWRNQLIKQPLMNLVNREESATYVTINKGEIYIPEAIKAKSYGLDGDMTQILQNLREAVEGV